MEINFRLIKINEFESNLCSNEYYLNSSEIKASLSIVHYYDNCLNHIHSLIHNSLQTLLDNDWLPTLLSLWKLCESPPPPKILFLIPHSHQQNMFC